MLCAQSAGAELTWPDLNYTESLCLQDAQVSGWFTEKNISQTICFTELTNQFCRIE